MLAQTLQNDIGAKAFGMTEYEKACFCFETALKLREKELKRRHDSSDARRILLQVALTCNNIAALRRNHGRHEEALGYWRKSLEIKIEVHGSNSPDVATTHQAIGLLLQEIKKTDEARHHLLQVEAIRRQALPSEHPLTKVSAKMASKIISIPAGQSTLMSGNSTRQATKGKHHRQVAAAPEEVISYLLEEPAWNGKSN